MSKARQIIGLLAEGKSVAEVAQIVGCRIEHIEEVMLFAIGLENSMARRHDHGVPHKLRSAFYRQAYKEARQQGLSGREQRAYAASATNIFIGNLCALVSREFPQ